MTTKNRHRTTRMEGRLRGGALVAALVTMLLGAGLVWSALSVTSSDRREIARESQHIEARAIAEAGAHRALAFVRSTLKLDPFDPIGEIDRIAFTNGDLTQPIAVTIASDEALDRDGRRFGTFSVVMTAAPDGEARQLTITSTGYIPDRATARAKETVRAVVEVGLEPGQVFDYGYFINNWGWFYGDTINAYGNVRSNAQFDAADYSPGVFGTPRYESVALTDPTQPDLQGYIDDNQDGLLDGSDGGVFAGWNIVGADSLRGMGGQTENQHDFVDQVPMPNLSNLAVYEARAKANNASVQLGGGTDASGNPLPPTTVCNAVLGDESGEKQNVVLIGTAAKPIILNGPVVVRGDVIIKGVVTGQGAIYSGRNVYVADNLTYANGPATFVPTNESEAAAETWIAQNRSKDFCGLFAKENIVLGNFTHSWWRYYVGWWLGDSMNKSREDAGADLLQNTSAGRDGVVGTEDDDTLEDDGLFTVDHYTQEQADLGLLPAGKSVGDVIPGSGEDIDGDGVYDNTLDLTVFDLSAALGPTAWAGNLPAGTTKFSSLSSIAITDVHAVLYTNHAAALLTLAWGLDFHLFGSIVSRNESLIYGTNSMNLYNDRRLQGGGLYPTMLPQTVAPLRIVSWSRLESDVRVLEATP